jgi:hypothetical protein
MRFPVAILVLHNLPELLKDRQGKSEAGNGGTIPYNQGHRQPPQDTPGATGVSKNVRELACK